MQPLKIYDYLTVTRQQVFERVRPLSAEQYAREFPIVEEAHLRGESAPRRQHDVKNLELEAHGAQHLVAG